MKDSESRKLLDWLSPINAGAKHCDISEKRQPGTGQWVLDTLELRQWLAGATRTLWCPGARTPTLIISNLSLY